MLCTICERLANGTKERNGNAQNGFEIFASCSHPCFLFLDALGLLCIGMASVGDGSLECRLLSTHVVVSAAAQPGLERKNSVAGEEGGL